jgi:hypothetical protein
MKTGLIAIVLTVISCSASFAEDIVGKGQHFEQKKAEVLKHIDQRIARNQEERACVQAAANHDALKACREKFKAEMKSDRQVAK